MKDVTDAAFRALMCTDVTPALTLRHFRWDQEMFFFSKLNPIVVIALIAGVVVASALGWGSILQFASFGALLLYGAAILLGDS